MKRLLTSRTTRQVCILAAVVLIGWTTCEAAFLPVHRDPKKKDARVTVEKLEEQWRVAQLAGDAAAMDRLLSDDFVGISAFGQVNTKAQQLARVRDRSIALTRFELSDVKVKLIRDVVAVVTSRAEIAGTNDGVPVNGTFRYTRIYQRLANGMWKITSFEATRVPGGENGHPRTEAEAAQHTHP